MFVFGCRVVAMAPSGKTFEGVPVYRVQTAVDGPWQEALTAADAGRVCAPFGPPYAEFYRRAGPCATMPSALSRKHGLKAPSGRGAGIYHLEAVKRMLEWVNGKRMMSLPSKRALDEEEEGERPAPKARLSDDVADLRARIESLEEMVDALIHDVSELVETMQTRSEAPVC
jgi:hypothetical protein